MELLRRLNHCSVEPVEERPETRQPHSHDTSSVSSVAAMNHDLYLLAESSVATTTNLLHGMRRSLKFETLRIGALCSPSKLDRAFPRLNFCEQFLLL